MTVTNSHDGEPITQALSGLHIEGRRWFDRKWGNTYHSVYVYGNGTMIASNPYEYGYGDQYIETALDLMESRGLIPERERRPNGSKPGGTIYLRETLGASYSVADVSRKRDL